MMGYKDTVMSWERMRMIMEDNRTHNRGAEWAVEEYCLAQAEITWKARDKEIDEARKAGIEEVVEWLINDSFDTTIHFGEDWQAKLKDWGI